MLSILYGALSPLGITRGYQCYAKGTVWPSNMNSENTLHARFHHCGGTIPAAGWTPAATPTARQTRSRPPSPTLQHRSRIVASCLQKKAEWSLLTDSIFPPCYRQTMPAKKRSSCWVGVCAGTEIYTCPIRSLCCCCPDCAAAEPSHVS